MPDDEPQSQLELSDSETQFIPQEDDAETLWEVIEITAEKGKNYRVRWKGNDPKTQKPWPQSWVAKHDCTDDLVQDWKLRQAKKKNESARRPKRSCTSVATVKSSTSSLTSKRTASPSKLDSTGRSISTTTTITTRRGPSKATPVAKTGTKRRHGEITSATTSTRMPASSTFPTAGAEGDARSNTISESIPPPRKKRKLEMEVLSNYENSTSTPEVVDNGRKRRRRKLILSDHDDDDVVEVKTESDGFVEAPKSSELQRQKSTSPSQAEEERGEEQGREEQGREEQADERMIEESLSDMYYNPPQSSPLQPSHHDEDEGTPIPPVRAQAPAHRQEDTVEENTPTLSRLQRKEKRTNSPPTTSKIDPPNKKGIRPPPSSSSATTVNPTVSNAATGSCSTTKLRVLTLTPKSKTTKKPNKRKKNFTPKYPSTDLEDIYLDDSMVGELPPSANPAPDQASSSRAANSRSHSSTGHHPEPISRRMDSSGPSAESSTTIAIPATPPRNRGGDANGENNGHRPPILSPTAEKRLSQFDAEEGDINGQNDGHKSPILSPGAKKRLGQFDRAVMKIALEDGKGKEKAQPPEDGPTALKEEKAKDGEKVVAGGSRRQEHGLVRTSEGKGSKGKEKEQITEEGASTSKPTETEKKQKTKPPFLPHESASEDEPAAMPKGQEHGRGKSKSKSTSKESSHPPMPVLPSYNSKPISKPQSKVDTNTVQTNPPSSTAILRRSANPRANSFVNDIIPETEESQSQSQEVQADLQVPAPSHAPVPRATPSTKPTLKSRMKPKTPQPKSRPLSRTSSVVGALALRFRVDMDVGVPNDLDEVDEDNGAEEAVKTASNKKVNENSATVFRPIPRISPSIFKAHLPSSSLPDSIVEATEGDGDDAVKRISDRNEEEDSIEQFESPTKDERSEMVGEGRVGVLTAARREQPRAKESAADIWNSDLNRRGRELAEAARRKGKERLRAQFSFTKDMPEVKNDIFGYPASVGLDRLPDLQKEEMNPDVSMQSSPPDDLGDTDSLMQQMEDAYVDLSGGVHASAANNCIHLREEEEESSQDLMMELALHQQQQGLVVVGQSGDHIAETRNDTAGPPPAIHINSQPTNDNDKPDRSMDEIPSILVERPSRATSIRSPLEDGPSHQKARSKSRSRSRQKDKSEKEPDSQAEIPPTASTRRESPQTLSQPTNSQTESVDNPHHLGAAMHLLNTKSEEISELEGQLSAARRANEDLLQQLSALRLHSTQSTNDAQSAITTLEQALADERASWETERTALALSNETATRAKASAEQDREFFREQYAKASAFVSSVRDENAELEKQIKIATSQAQSGVNLIRATFELRTKSLEEDVRAWRRMAEFLMEKDRRTNDDIRKRAGEEPELRARCDRQGSVLKEISERLEQLEMALEEKQRFYIEAKETGKRWKEATMKLNLELNEANTKLERIGKVGIGDGDPNGHEFVYRCQWRPDDSNDSCNAVFKNISELQEHLYTGGHLHD